LQIVWSRFFAATLTYYYAFMLVSLAMLGLAAGGLAVRVFPRLFPQELVWQRACILSLATGLAILFGTLGVLAIYPHLTFSTRYELSDPWELASVFWCCFPAFLAGGALISGVLTSRRDIFHRLYAIDLTFAAAGCVIGLFLLDVATPVELLLTSAPLLPLIAAFLFALQAGHRKLTFAALAITVVVAAAGALLAMNPARAKPPHLAWRDQTELLSEWNATSSVRVYTWRFFTWSLSPTYRGPTFPALELIIDGLGGTPIVKFDGRAESLAKYEYLDADLTALPHHLIQHGARQVVIGPGGGVDVLQAVRAGLTDITAVEINPLVASVVNDHAAEFSGSPYRLPGVRTVIENGRTFIKRAREKWDLITLTWVDTGGSATALAFSENYLYTVEAFGEYLAHLRPGGFVSFLRAWPVPSFRVDALRGISVAVEALLRAGAKQPGDHVLVAVSKGPFYWRTMCLVLVRPTPFSDEDVANAQRFLDERQFQAIWLPGARVALDRLPPELRADSDLVHGIITSRDRASFYQHARLDVTPATDDNPFYFVERAGAARAAGNSVLQLSSYVLILATLVVPFLFAPAVALLRGTRRLRSGDFAALGYFALLGISFMLVEIEFFHLFALLLGKPTLTFAVVLCSLLVSSGLGSLLGERVAEGSRARILALFATLTALLLGFSTTGAHVVDSLVGLSLAARVAVTIAIVAPIAFLMGIPMPAGMRLLVERRDLMLWGWALNGALSVFASVAAMYLAIHHGIGFTFAIGCAGYALAGVLLIVVKARVARAA
jgi:predicted membrane-bound spermidine synthase